MALAVDLPLPDGKLKRACGKQKAAQSTKAYVRASQPYREDSQQLAASFAAVGIKVAALLRLSFIFSEEEGNRTVEYHVIVVSEVVDLLESPVLEGELGGMMRLALGVGNACGRMSSLRNVWSSDHTADNYAGTRRKPSPYSSTAVASRRMEAGTKCWVLTPGDSVRLDKRSQLKSFQ